MLAVSVSFQLKYSTRGPTYGSMSCLLFWCCMLLNSIACLCLIIIMRFWWWSRTSIITFLQNEMNEVIPLLFSSLFVELKHAVIYHCKPSLWIEMMTKIWLPKLITELDFKLTMPYFTFEPIALLDSKWKQNGFAFAVLIVLKLVLLFVFKIMVAI